MRTSGKPVWQKKLAMERIECLFKTAELSFKEKPEESHRYVQLARKIAMRYNLKMPEKFKRKFCRKCNMYLKPGVNCTIRAKNRVVVIKCLECGAVKRYPYK